MKTYYNVKDLCKSHKELLDTCNELLEVLKLAYSELDPNAIYVRNKMRQVIAKAEGN